MSELGVASRRPLLPNESQVNASMESSGCCWKIRCDRSPDDGVDDRGVDRDDLAGGQLPGQQFVEHRRHPANPLLQFGHRRGASNLLVDRDPAGGRRDGEIPRADDAAQPAGAIGDEQEFGVAVEHQDQCFGGRIAENGGGNGVVDDLAGRRAWRVARRPGPVAAAARRSPTRIAHRPAGRPRTAEPRSVISRATSEIWSVMSTTSGFGEDQLIDLAVRRNDDPLPGDRRPARRGIGHRCWTRRRVRRPSPGSPPP